VAHFSSAGDDGGDPPPRKTRAAGTSCDSNLRRKGVAHLCWWNAKARGGALSEQRRRERLLAVLDGEGARIFATLTRLTLRHDVAADLLQELFLRLQTSETFFAAENPAAFAWRTALNLATQ